MKLLLPLFIIIIAVAAAFVWTGNKDETRTYTNGIYGFSLSYPRDLMLQEHSNDRASINDSKSDSTQSVAEISILPIQELAGGSFPERITRSLEALCPTPVINATTTSCVGTEESKEFMTTSDHGGLTYRLADKEIFVFLTGTGETADTLIIIHPPISTTTENIQASKVRSIAKSMTFNR